MRWGSARKARITTAHSDAKNNRVSIVFAGTAVHLAAISVITPAVAMATP